MLTSEYLAEHYVSLGKAASQIAAEAGVTKGHVCRLLKKYGIAARSRGGSKASDLTGKKFERLRVLGRSSSARRRRVTWSCRCSCGNSVDVTTDALMSGHTRSCGCLRREYAESVKAEGFGELSGSYFERCRRGAAKRGLPFEITPEYAYRLYASQVGRCALTGLEISLSGRMTASLDRIDSRRGYVKGNLQWVHKLVNRMKGDMDETQFRRLCSLVALGLEAVK